MFCKVIHLDYEQKNQEMRNVLKLIYKTMEQFDRHLSAKIQSLYQESSFNLIDLDQVFGLFNSVLKDFKF